MHLGEPYNLVTTCETIRPRLDDVHDRLLKVLQSENRMSRGYPRIPRRRYTSPAN